MKGGVEEILTADGRKRYLVKVFVVAGIFAVAMVVIWLQRFEYRDHDMASGAKIILRHDRFTGKSCIMSANPVEAGEQYKSVASQDWCLTKKM